VGGFKVTFFREMGVGVEMVFLRETGGVGFKVAFLREMEGRFSDGFSLGSGGRLGIGRQAGKPMRGGTGRLCR